MKTKEQLTRENERIIDDYAKNSESLTKRDLNQMRKDIAMNKQLILALDAGMMQRDFEAQLEVLNDRIHLIDNGFSEWQKNTPFMMLGENPKKTYEQSTDLQMLKEQRKFIRNILD